MPNELNPAAKLLIQRYILGVVTLYGSIALAVIGIIATVVFNGIHDRATLRANKAVEETIESREDELDKALSRMDSALDDSVKRIFGIETRTNQLAADVASAKGKAVAEIGASRRDAERAFEAASARARQLSVQSEAFLAAVEDKSPDVAEALRAFSERVTSFQNAQRDLSEQHEKLQSRVDAFSMEFNSVPRLIFALVQADGTVTSQNDPSFKVAPNPDGDYTITFEAFRETPIAIACLHRKKEERGMKRSEADNNTIRVTAFPDRCTVHIRDLRPGGHEIATQNEVAPFYLIVAGTR